MPAIRLYEERSAVRLRTGGARPGSYRHGGPVGVRTVIRLPELDHLADVQDADQQQQEDHDDRDRGAEAEEALPERLRVA